MALAFERYSKMSDENNNNPRAPPVEHRSPAEAIASILHGFSYLARHASDQAVALANHIQQQHGGPTTLVHASPAREASPVPAVQVHASPAREARSVGTVQQSHQQNVTQVGTNPEPNPQFFPDGDVSFVADPPNMKSNGIPHLAHCLRSFDYYRNKTTGEISRKWWCVGVMKCPVQGCTFVKKPYKPKSSKIGSQPFAPSNSGIDERECPAHNRRVEWIQCTGSNHPETGESQPCIVVAVKKRNGETVVHHKGKHNHPFVPDDRPSPAAIQNLENLVRANPNVGAARLAMGTEFSPSLSDQHPAWHNTDRVRELRKHILQKDGLRFATGANIQRFRELDMEYFVLEDFTNMFSKSSPTIITMQSPYMRDVLQEASAGFQSDTIEGIIRDPNYVASTVDLHFTTGFDRITGRWVPVLISIVFGRSKESFVPHWDALLAYAIPEEQEITTWEAFKNHFPGVTCDWSQALGQSYLEVLEQFAHTFPDGESVQKEDCKPFYRLCGVHFKRSLNRISRNKKYVPEGRKDELDKLVDDLCSESKFSVFVAKARKIVSQFENLGAWLSWYLHKDRAPSFFPACQNFNSEQYSRFYKFLSSSTNAQESIGGVFQMYFTKPLGRKISIDEAIQFSLNFAISYESKRNGALRGLPDKWNSPRKGKRPRSRNDGKPNERAYRVQARKPIEARKPSEEPIMADKEPSEEPIMADKEPREEPIMVDKEPIFEEEEPTTSDSPPPSGAPLFVKLPDGTWHYTGGEQHALTTTSDNPKFTGIPWAIPGGLTMSCPLDCAMMALYLPHFAGQNTRPYVELESSDSVLSRTFKLLDLGLCDQARLLWMDEVMGIDLASKTSMVDIEGGLWPFFDFLENENCPIAESSRSIFRREVSCTWKPCMSEGHELVDPESNQEYGPVESAYMLFRTHPDKFDRDGFLSRKLDFTKEFDYTFAKHKLNPCRRTFYGTDGHVESCLGKEAWISTEFLQYPRFLILNMVGCKALLSELVVVGIPYNNRIFQIRSCILGDGNHFTCVYPVRELATDSNGTETVHYGWLHYDGMLRPQFEFYSLGDADHAMNGRGLSSVIMECVDSSVHENNGATKPIRWNELILAKNSLSNTGHSFYGKPLKPLADTGEVVAEQAVAIARSRLQSVPEQEEEPEQANQPVQEHITQSDIASQLTELSKDIRASPNKALPKKRGTKAKTTTKRRSRPRKKRDPRLSSGRVVGFRYKEFGFNRKKTCKSCHGDIVRDTPCFYHTFPRKEGSPHLITHYYCRRIGCISLMDTETFKKFAETDWESYLNVMGTEETDKQLGMVISQMKRMRQQGK